MVKIVRTGTLIVVTLFRDLLFVMGGMNNDWDVEVIGTFGKGGLNELDGELEW